MVFVPLHDDAPLRVIRFQLVNGLLLVTNLLIFLYTDYALSEVQLASFATSVGVVPAVLTDHAVLDPSLVLIPEPMTLLTYMFIHADWMHLLSNMLFLWVFGDNVEDAYGHLGFLVFFLVCGIAAGLIHALMFPNSQMPLIGASGAVSGVLAAYLVLFPHSRVWILLFMRLPIKIPASIVLVGWLLLQIASLVLTEVDSEGVTVAWWAHIGGFGTGLLITYALRNRLRERLAPRLNRA
ncbi:MAG: rhomboid family intramembrane serine protease [Hyphomicrobiales bacterium]